MPILPFQGFRDPAAPTPQPGDTQPAPSVAAPPPALTPPPAPAAQMTSGRRERGKRTAGTGAPASASSFASEDDYVRAHFTSPTGRAAILQPDGTLRWVEGVPFPPGTPAPAPTEPHPLQAVLDEFPEVAQPGTSANHRF